jgi:hypothetical protein
VILGIPIVLVPGLIAAVCLIAAAFLLTPWWER